MVRSLCGNATLSSRELDGNRVPTECLDSSPCASPRYASPSKRRPWAQNLSPAGTCTTEGCEQVGSVHAIRGDIILPLSSSVMNTEGLHVLVDTTLGLA